VKKYVALLLGGLYDGSICGEGLCLPGHACIYLKAYDLTYKRYCYYEFIT
jgi:hypothetical protein